MLLWHLADRWGRVRSDGVIVALDLTHSVLAELVAARRPTVTRSLSELADKGWWRPGGGAGCSAASVRASCSSSRTSPPSPSERRLRYLTTMVPCMKAWNWQK